MKFTYKLLCFILSLVLFISIGCVTFYAEPNDDNGENQPPNTSDVTNPPVNDPPATEPQQPNDISQPDTPNDNNNPDYTGDTSDNTYNFTDNNQNNSFDFTQRDTNSGYTDTDGNWVPYADNSQYDDNYTYNDTQKQEDSTEATLYDVQRKVDTNTLSSDDWKLDLNTNGLNGTENFNFIKNNNSSFDSNRSIMFLYGGIALIVISVVTMFVVIYKSAQSKKLSAVNRVPFGKENRKNQKSKYTSSKNKHHYRKNDTAEININRRKK